MGCMSPKKEKISEPKSMEELQYQTDLQFCKKIFQMVAFTLNLVALKFTAHSYPRAIQIDLGIYCSQKNLDQLKNQLIINTYLFEISKRKIQRLNSKFTQICQCSEYLKIAYEYLSFFQQKDSEVVQICQKIVSILQHKYTKQVQNIQTFPLKDRTENNSKTKIVELGIKATLAMEDIVNKHRQALNFNDAGTTINNDVHQKKE